jgi:dGTPase
LKHCSREHAQALEAAEPGGVGRRFLEGAQPSIEAQLANLADEIAYNAHDIDDGVRSGLLTMEQLGEVPLFARFRDEALRAHPHLEEAGGRRLLFETIRRMLSEQVYDVIAATSGAISALGVESANGARSAPRVVRFSEEMRHASGALKRFLFRALYRHPQVVETTGRARQIVRELFAAYGSLPQELPADYRHGEPLPRSIADYIAGMTDRFAIREHERLTGRRLFS